MNRKRLAVRICTKTRRQAGFALLVAMIVLVVLSSVAAGLSLQLTMAKRRQQYLIEYQRARYGLDSAIKYIFTEMPRRTFKLESRTDAPDFSDLFWMTDAAYGDFINSWLATATEEQIEAVMKEQEDTEMTALTDEDLAGWLSSLFGGGDTASTEPNAVDDPGLDDPEIVQIDPNDIEVPGPYGPAWPYVCEPIELTIGTAKITITIEDENAKMPLSWLVTNFRDVNKQAEHSLKTFGAWMQMEEYEIEELQASLEDIYKQKMFKVNPNPILLQKKSPRSPAAARFSRRRHSRTTTAANTAQASKSNQRPASAHATDFAKLFHSSMLSHEILMRPLPETGERVENAYKYLSLWGAQRININTAPRHILEAAFMLTLDAFEAPELAQTVIEMRKEKPFAKIEELKDAGMLSAENFDNLKNYITVSSSFFKIRVTSSSGNAGTSAVVTVIKENKNVEPLAVMYGY